VRVEARCALFLMGGMLSGGAGHKRNHSAHAQHQGAPAFPWGTVASIMSHPRPHPDKLSTWQPPRKSGHAATARLWSEE
jgi:hypothetical protein